MNLVMCEGDLISLEKENSYSDFGLTRGNQRERSRTQFPDTGSNWSDVANGTVHVLRWFDKVCELRVVGSLLNTLLFYPGP